MQKLIKYSPVKREVRQSEFDSVLAEHLAIVIHDGNSNLAAREYYLLRPASLRDRVLERILDLAISEKLQFRKLTKEEQEKVLYAAGQQYEALWHKLRIRFGLVQPIGKSKYYRLVIQVGEQEWFAAAYPTDMLYRLAAVVESRLETVRPKPMSKDLKLEWLLKQLG